MVCAKCEAKERATKTTSLAVTDVWKASGSGSDQRNERKVGGNKLLEAKKKYGGSVPSSSGARSTVKPGAGGGAGTGVGSSKRGASQTDQFGKCKVCKVTVAKTGAILCQRASLSLSLSLVARKVCGANPHPCELGGKQAAHSRKESASCARQRYSTQPSTR